MASELLDREWKRPLGRTGFESAPLFLGTYRLPSEGGLIKAALEAGVRGFDVAPSYSSGEAEWRVGAVLQGRTGVFVSGKAGTLEGESMQRALSRARDGRAYANTLKIREDAWACFEPEFLRDEITASLERTGLGCLDGLLLQNPEHLLVALGDAEPFYEHMRRAFEFLESEVTAGRVRWYGVSSNTLGGDEDDEAYVSLERLLETAGGHFALLSLPLNAYELDAAVRKNCSGRTVLDAAADAGIGVLVNRPFRAFDGRRMLILRDRAGTRGDADSGRARVSEALERVRDLEASLPSEADTLREPMSWSSHMEQTLEWIQDHPTWSRFRESAAEPALKGMAEIYGGYPEPAVRGWFDRYRSAVENLIDRAEGYFRTVDSARTRALHERLDSACPELRGLPSLSAKLFVLYASLRGVSAVVTGTGSRDHLGEFYSAMETVAPLGSGRALDVLRGLTR